MLNDPTQLTPSVPATPAAPAAAPNGAAPEAPVDAKGRTVEEVEAEYKARLSGKDRAHNVAEQTLREQNEDLQKRLDAALNASAAGTGQAGSPGEASAPNPLAPQLAQERALREQAEQRALIADRRAKYPALANFVHESVLVGPDEASLAKLNASLDDSVGSGNYIAPTSPGRSAPVQTKPYSEMTKQELLDQLARQPEGIARRPSSG